MQGFGLTENDELPEFLLETTVRIISNDVCRDWTIYNISSSPIKRNKVYYALPGGINDFMLCTVGILNEETGIYSVSF